jgi:hypothetical protein
MLGIKLARDCESLPELGDMSSRQRDEIERDDRDLAFPVVDQEDPAPQRPLHPLAGR